jgi:hypothetical protein
MEEKAPTPPALQSVLDLPQERISGDILRGYGPRRGNLERLLRYWRPIMRKPGGFRRCRRILANHPELYPLERICAWLHHETTGLWPNEGCHHPGMKNCRGKIRKGNRGSLWTDKEWERRLARRFRRGKKGLAAPQENYVVTEADFKYAMNVLSEFAEMEKGFVEYLRDDKNWMHVGEDDDGNEVEHEWAKADGGDCGCGCGDG